MIGDEAMDILKAQIKLEMLIEARRVLGTGIKNLEFWLTERIKRESEKLLSKEA